VAEAKFAQFVRGEHLVYLAFDLSEHQLLLCHHVHCLRLQDLLLVILDESLLPSAGAFELDLQIEIVLLELVVVALERPHLVLNLVSCH